MRSIWSSWRLCLIAAIIGLASLGGAKPAAADNLRYGHLSWKQVGPLTAQFTLMCAFNRSAYPGRASDGFLAVGDRFQETGGAGAVTRIDLDDGSFATGPGGGALTFVAVAIDPSRNWVLARALAADGSDYITHTYPAPFQNDPARPNFGGPWRPTVVARRAGGLNNNATNLILTTTVDFLNNRHSPVTSLVPEIVIPQSGGSFFIPAGESDGHTVRFRLATTAESGGTQPTGVTVDPLTGEYTVPSTLPAGRWATQVIIEEYDAGALLVGEVPVDFVVNVTALEGSAPTFAPPTPIDGTRLTAVVGRNTRFVVRATDPDGGVVRLNFGGVPVRARQVAALPTVGAPAVSQFDWTPIQSDVGSYVVTYSAEDATGNMTVTSIILQVISGLDLLEPDGGEFYPIGSELTITWDAGGIVRPSGVRIELSRDGGTTWESPAIADATPDDGSFTWLVTGPSSVNCRIRITNVDDPLDFGISAADFSIGTGTPISQCTDQTNVAIPDNTPAWTEIPITITDDLIIRAVQVAVNFNHPFSGDLEIEVQHPDGTRVLLHDETGAGTPFSPRVYGHGLAFTLPAEPLTTLYGKRSVGTWLLRVRDLNPGDIGQVADWCLNLVGPNTGTFTITAPVGGERWAVGTTQVIRWTQEGIVGDADIQISRDSGATWTTVGTVPAAAGAFDWLVTGPETTTARVRLVSVVDPIQFSVSDADFTIQNPVMRVLQPNGGESISTGRVYQIKWDAVPMLPSESVNIELSQDGGSTWSTIAGGAANTGTFSWTPTPAQVTTQGRIRVTANDAPIRVDVSDADFVVQEPEIAITAPATTDTWYTYTTRTIQWTAVGVTGNVNIEVSRNGGSTWELIFVDTENDGQQDWLVTGPPTDNALVRIRSIDNPEFEGASDVFAIREMTVRVTSPNGGETFGIGEAFTITWESDGVPGNVDIAISRDGGQSFEPVATDVPNGGSFEWVGTGAATSQALIRVSARGYPPADESDAVFSIVEPSVVVVSPAGGEELRVGQPALLQWSTTGVAGRVRIELTRDDGATWETLFEDTANDGSEAWTVTGPDTATARIRVATLSGTSGTSEAVFKIVTPAITVTAPNGGEQWFSGALHTLTWNTAGLDGNVRIELTRDGGQTWEIINSSTPNDGTEDWVVSGTGTANARVRITSLAQPEVSDESNGPFTIVEPSITLGAPNGGQLWLIGRTQLITWRTVGVTGNLDIELSLDGGATWTPLIENTPDDGSEAWTVSGPVTSSARIRISWRGHSNVFDASDSNFTITNPSIQVTSPSGGDRWRVGDLQTITWDGSALAAGGTVDIQLSRNNGRTYKTIIADTANDGSVTWQVAKPLSKKCKIRVVWKPSPDVSGTSTGTFRILKAAKKKKAKR